MGKLLLYFVRFLMTLPLSTLNIKFAKKNRTVLPSVREFGRNIQFITALQSEISDLNEKIVTCDRQMTRLLSLTVN